MKLNRRHSPAYQAGFSLVEIMVGLVIGMLASLVIIQIMSVFETQKRSTTGSADAQTNGAIALFTIEQQLKMAGYPVMPTGLTESPFKCTTLRVNGAVSSPLVISPIIITDGGGNASDTITINFGNSRSGGIPTKITALPVGLNATVVTNFGCLNGDATLISNSISTACDMSTVNTGGAPGVSIPPPNTTIPLTDVTGVIPGSSLACLGIWNTVSYSVNNGDLVDQAGNPVVAGIVNIQAQYGISATANSNVITNWVDGGGATWGPAALTVANRNRIKAVRVAVVARNPKMEPAAVTQACNIAVVPPTGLCAWAGTVANPAPPINMAAADANWLRYRYRVFETIIPVRNIIWSLGAL